MSLAAIMHAWFGPVFGPAARRRNGVRRNGFRRNGFRQNWFLAAIDAHTRRQIELALGERIEEFNHAVRERRDRETR